MGHCLLKRATVVDEDVGNVGLLCFPRPFFATVDTFIDLAVSSVFTSSLNAAAQFVGIPDVNKKGQNTSRDRFEQYREAFWQKVHKRRVLSQDCLLDRLSSCAIVIAMRFPMPQERVLHSHELEMVHGDVVVFSLVVAGPYLTSRPAFDPAKARIDFPLPDGPVNVTILTFESMVSTRN